MTDHAIRLAQAMIAASEVLTPSEYSIAQQAAIRFARKNPRNYDGRTLTRRGMITVAAYLECIIR